MSSFNFNGTDMSAYGVEVISHNLWDFTQEAETFQLAEKTYGGTIIRPAREITLDIVVKASDFSTLCGYLDSIKSVLNLKTDAALKIDTITDRYWLARFSRLVENDNSDNVWTGQLIFTAFDAPAYDNNESTSGPHTIDEDPENINVSIGGTTMSSPVYTLTADDVATEVTIANATTGEELIVTIDLVATDELEIDTANMIVKLNDTESMSGVAGQFPRLLPGTNAFSINGFSGSMSIVYRKRYL